MPIINLFNLLQRKEVITINLSTLLFEQLPKKPPSTKSLQSAQPHPPPGYYVNYGELKRFFRRIFTPFNSVGI